METYTALFAKQNTQRLRLVSVKEATGNLLIKICNVTLLATKVLTLLLIIIQRCDVSTTLSTN